MMQCASSVNVYRGHRYTYIHHGTWREGRNVLAERCRANSATLVYNNLRVFVKHYDRITRCRIHCSQHRPECETSPPSTYLHNVSARVHAPFIRSDCQAIACRSESCPDAQAHEIQRLRQMDGSARHGTSEFIHMRPVYVQRTDTRVCRACPV